MADVTFLEQVKVVPCLLFCKSLCNCWEQSLSMRQSPWSPNAPPSVFTLLPAHLSLTYRNNGRARSAPSRALPLPRLQGWASLPSRFCPTRWELDAFVLNPIQPRRV